MARQQVNIRVHAHTVRLLKEVCSWYGLSESDVLTMALERFDITRPVGVRNPNGAIVLPPGPLISAFGGQMPANGWQVSEDKWE